MTDEVDSAAGAVAGVAADTPHSVEVADQAYRAHQLRLQGMAWADVAEQAGYETPQNAILAVNSYLQRAALDQAVELGQMALHQELARLDALQAKWWPSAELLDKDAAQIVLKIIAQRAKLLRLDGATKITGGQTIIITSESDMAAQLRAIAEGH